MVDKSNVLANRIKNYIEGSVPVKSDNGYTLNIEKIDIKIPEENYDIENHLKMRYTGEGKTEGYISGTISIENEVGTSIHKGHYAKLVVFPVATDRGSYIVNGIEKNIVSQMRMKPGIYTSNQDKFIKTQIRFSRDVQGGTFIPAMTLMLDNSNKNFFVRIVSYGKENKINVINFLSLLGFSDLEIQKSFGDSAVADSILNINLKKRNEKSMEYLYKIFFPRSVKGEVLTDSIRRDKVIDLLSNKAKFGDGSVIKATLNSSATTLNKEVILKSVKKTVSVAAGLVEDDIKDEMKFKEIYSDIDLIFDSIKTGLDKFINKTVTKIEAMDETQNKEGILAGISSVIHDDLNGKKGLMGSELCVTSEQINPLFMEAKSREITQNGPGAMGSDANRNETEARNLTASGMNKIDPIETPESSKIGITQHLASGALIENRTIKSELLKVLDGKAIDDEGSKVKLSSMEEEDHVIAFNDSRYVEYKDGVYEFKEDNVPVRYRGKTENMPVSKVEFIDSKPQSMLGTSANLIPFVSFNDGARALMGAAMQKQAVNLVNREVPLVSTLSDKKSGMTFEQSVGNSMCKPIRCLCNGTVSNITNSKIIVTDDTGAEFSHSYYNYFPLNQNYINNELVVKKGDLVKIDQILAEGWQTKGDTMALGANARIGYLPYKGYNYEDGGVISESFAEKMTSDEYDEIEILIPKTAKGGRGSLVKSELVRETTNACLRTFDKDGIINQGESIKSGSVLVGYMKEINKDTTDLLDLISLGGDKKSYKYSEISVPAGSYVSGNIVRITVIDNPDAMNRQKIVFSVADRKPLKTGDKIAGRHGNKVIVTKILPDELMPVGADGKTLDIMMSPLAVPSRKNLGQILEVGAGLIAEKTGEKFVVDNFNHKEKERVLSKLEEIGYKDGQMAVTLKEQDEKGNIISVPTENPVTVGNIYIMKLKHKVDDKIQSRSNRETSLTSKTYMPAKFVGTAQGEKSNPQRLGEMEMRALQAHGATFNLLENTTIKADGAGDSKGKAAIFKAIATGKLDSADLDKNIRPETLKVMSDSLKILGLDVKPLYNGVETSIDRPFNSLGLSPINQDEFIKTIGSDKEVSKGDMLQARQFFRDESDDSDTKASPESKGGLLDTDIFGEDRDPKSRDKWGYIKLPMPIPNPVFMESQSHNIYESITGLSKGELKSLTGMSEQKNKPIALITDLSTMNDVFSKMKNPELVQMYKDNISASMIEHGFKPGDLVSLDVLDKLKKEGVNIPYKTGGDALEFILKSVDVKSGLGLAKKELEEATGADNINKAFKKVRAFEMLEKNKIKPNDLMVKVVPVAPTYLRPVIANRGDENIFINDLNKLYRKVILAKKISEKDAVLDENGTLKQMGLAPNDIGQRSKVLYNSLKSLHGDLAATDNGKPLKSVKGTLGGKNGLVRKEMLGKRVDFSGRSVITVNPNLKLNEVGIPLDMAKQLFKPFAIRELVKKGLCENESKAEDMIKKSDPRIKSVLQEIANERPVLLNRQPSLHKHSLQGLKAVIKDFEDGGVVRSIQLNPLVVTGFNADFDGDSSINSIISRKKITNTELDLAENKPYNLNPETKDKGDSKMPINENIRYTYGVINLRDFPRKDLIKSSGNKELYNVPEDVEVLTIWNGEKKWIKPESFSVHKELNMLDVKTSSSRSIQISDDHSIVTIDDNLDYKRDKAFIGATVPRLREVVSCNEKYELLNEIPIDIKKEKKYSVKTDKFKLNRNTGYLLGVYIGDGWTSNSATSYSISLASASRNVPEEIKNIMLDYIDGGINICSVEQPHYYDGYKSYCEKHTWSSKTFHAFISKHIGNMAENKHLPEFWMNSNEEFRWGLLSGLIDTDGTVNFGKSKVKKKASIYVGYTTISRVLAYEIVSLAHTLDLVASVCVTKTPKGRECYQITFTQESIMKMQKKLSLIVEEKSKNLSKAVFLKSYNRNRYCPKLSNDRLKELRLLIGHPADNEGENIEENKIRRCLYQSIYRIARQNTAIRVETAKKIFNLNLEEFNEGFWKKWKDIVLDESIEWDLITEINHIDFITEAYDLTIPPAYTMVTESGIVIYDTMAVHVAVSNKANEEIKNLTMPYQNLLSPGDGKMIIEIRHEMALGIYQITRGWEKPKGKVIQYSNRKDLLRDYLMGKVSCHQKVRVPIYMQDTTAGQALFNSLIPEKIKKYRNFRVTWNKNRISKMMMDIYVETEKTGFKMFSKMEISNLFDEIKDLGFKASTRSGVSIGTKDFELGEEAKDKINKIISEGTKSGDTVSNWRNVETEIEKSFKEGLLSKDNALQIMMDSGSRANAQQIRKMVSNVGVGMDIGKNLLEPIKKSHYDGLSPQDYYNLGNDSRKGLYDRSVSTAKPGALAREIYSATQSMVINEKDCKTQEFIHLNKKDKTIKGRVAGKSVIDQNGKIICRKNQIIDTDMLNKIYSDDTIEMVPVRSVLRCKTRNGKCQMCYGANAGTIELVKIGTAIGVIASQAVGEPVTQMTMNTFHTGGANSSATLGLPRISSILSLSNSPNSKAILSEVSGIVTEVIDTPMSLTVIVGKKKHVYKKTNINDNPTLKVKMGDVVKKGDFLTAGDVSDISAVTNEEKGVTKITLTNADPNKLFSLKSKEEGQKSALNYTQDYLVDSMQHAISASNSYMDRRHSETIISKLTGTALVTDSGDSPYMKGQKADVSLFERWNRDNCTGTKAKRISPASIPPNKLIGCVLANDININGKTIIRKGQVVDNLNINLISKLKAITVLLKPIKYEVQLQGQIAAGVNQNDWFSNMAGGRGISDSIAGGAALGTIDNLSDPRSKVMTGKLMGVGEGATLNDEFKGKYGTKMSNFFNDKIDTNKYKK